MKFEWKQKEYAFHIYDVFSEWIFFFNATFTRSHKSCFFFFWTNQTWQFQSISHSAFYVLAKVFLNEKGKKCIVPNIIKDHLTARSMDSNFLIGIWMMEEWLIKVFLTAVRRRLICTHKALTKNK